MFSKIRAEDEKSSEPPSQIPSLPEDVIIDILARSSRFDYPSLSLVSKHFRSLVASPDLYARRSVLGCTEHCLYVVFSEKYTFDDGSWWLDKWYILSRKANGSRYLACIPSKLPVLHDNATTSVAVGSSIYVFGGMDHQNMTTNALSINCRSHTAEPLPRIPVPMYSRISCIIDEKIYVIGYCPPCPEKPMMVFNIKTKTWEHVMIKPEMMTALPLSYASVVMADKVYAKNCYNSYVYDPKESKWQRQYKLNSKYWENACVVDDVLYYHDRAENTLRAYDPNHKCWGVVEGLKELLAETRCSQWSYSVSYGGNMALLFCRRCEIWCAEISLERRQGGEIWGEVEWCDHVLTGNFNVMKSLAVMV
ncbi:hypothetical protein Bca4012_060103 [Brassica carinata]